MVLMVPVSARKNAYHCPKCGKYTVTIDIDEGITPMFFGCKATPNCTGTGHSMFYRVDGIENLPEPIIEWYKPTEAEARAKGQAEFAHAKQGGLSYRMIGRKNG